MEYVYLMYNRKEGAIFTVTCVSKEFLAAYAVNNAGYTDLHTFLEEFTRQDVQALSTEAENAGELAFMWEQENSALYVPKNSPTDTMPLLMRFMEGKETPYMVHSDHCHSCGKIGIPVGWALLDKTVDKWAAANFPEGYAKAYFDREDEDANIVVEGLCGESVRDKVQSILTRYSNFKVSDYFKAHYGGMESTVDDIVDDVDEDDINISFPMDMSAAIINQMLGLWAKNETLDHVTASRSECFFVINKEAPMALSSDIIKG